MRVHRPGWRDARVWIGIAIMAASVLLGARVLAAGDETVSVWSLVRDVAPGEELTTEDLQARDVRFADADAAGAYLGVEEELPDLVVTRALGAGELLPRGALGATAGSEEVQIAVPVSALRLPPSVGPGTIVDLYIDGLGRTGPDAGSGPVLREVRVVAAPRSDDGLGLAEERRLVLAVAPDDVAPFQQVLADTEEPQISVAVHP
ncbi:hypothetical protein [Nocardioides sp. R-C-SC26]|uniref:hypothetical protein n=1 Tax=Nocardioides sp. R-C-SC26 TaxID=2870414 RepID=UPI001E307249|nr:hypothetical protein [Nocardioides sp. R-C-SC26]